LRGTEQLHILFLFLQCKESTPVEFNLCSPMKIRSIKIEDPIELHKTGAIEVTVFTSTGERRWCFFFTPEGMSSCGNFIEGTSVRFHYGASHMILVSEISHIESALKDIER